jgi:hypothetical protein
MKIKMRKKVMAMALVLPAFCHAEISGKAAVERDIAAMEARNVAVEKSFPAAVSVLDYAGKARTVGGKKVWTDAVNAALKANRAVCIPASDEPYWIDGPLVVPSDRMIRAHGAVIRLLEPCGTVLVRNENAADGTLKPVDRTEGDRDIFILGGRWEDWHVKRAGYGKSGRFNDLPRKKGGNFYGVSTLLYFGNVSTLVIRDVVIARASGFAIQCGDAEDVICENVKFDSCYADGFHCNGNVRNLLVRDLSGEVGDDLVALNVYDWQDSSVNFGPGDTILCENLVLHRGHPAVRLQPAKYRYADGTVVDCSLRNVVMRGVRGIDCFKMYLQTPAYDIGTAHEWGEPGTAENIWFEDVEIDLDSPPNEFWTYMKSDPVRGHFGAFEIGCNLKGLHFRNVKVRFHCDRFPLSHLICVGPKSYVHKMKDGTLREIFDPWVSCTVEDVDIGGVAFSGTPPAEPVYAVAFDDINKDGESSGRGVVKGVVGQPVLPD